MSDITYFQLSDSFNTSHPNPEDAVLALLRMDRHDFIELVNAYIRECADGALLIALEDERVLPELRAELEVIRRTTELHEPTIARDRFLVGLLSCITGVDRLIRQSQQPAS